MAPLDRIDRLRGREGRVALRKEQPTMRVTMRESRQAAPDGVNVVSLIAGEQYDLPDFLASRYIERGLAEVPKAKAPAPENKAEPAPPENKAPAPSRRSTRRKKGD